MTNYQYLIIGGGLTGDAAARGIRELDGAGTIGMLSMETDPPYKRPFLSKGLWKGRPVEEIWRNTQELGVEMLLGRKAVQLNPQTKTVQDERGADFTYDKLLLAMGGSPNRLPFGDDNIIYYRGFKDYLHLRALTERGERFLVIGGSFIGSEVAAALRINGKQVVMVFPEDAIGAAIFPPDLAQSLNDYYAEKGVEVIAQDTVTGLEKSGERISANTRSGRTYEVDGVVAGIGIRPNLDLAQQAGLQIENGVLVDEQLRTTAADIYAAGDLANFYHSALGKRTRVEHEDNAIYMGKQAGRNMAGAVETYTHVPMFYSDLFDLGYEAVGEMSSKMETVADWKDPFQKGVLYYLAKGRVRGILLWNVWDKVPVARAILAKPGPFKAADLKGRIK